MNRSRRDDLSAADTELIGAIRSGLREALRRILPADGLRAFLVG